jgi:hypothetical protein
MTPSTENRGLRLLVVLGLLLCSLTCPLHVLATPDAQAVEGARALYVDGIALRMQGKLADSLSRLQAAHALYATPITTLELGRGLALLERYREAAAALVLVEDLPAKPGESEKAARARVEARELQLEYARRADEAERARALSAVTQPALASAPPPSTVPAAPPRVQTRVDAVPLPPARGAPVAPDRSELRQRRLLRAGIGIAAAGLATGAATGLVTLLRARTLRDACDNGICQPGSGLDTTLRVGRVASTAFAIGGVGVVVGAVALVMQARRAAPSSQRWQSALDAALQGAVRW